jgi:periplasmic divalent cation tolerance protein
MINIVYVTHPDMRCAKRISEELVSEKLAACSNILPIKSIYWWEGIIQSEGEVVSILKTIPENWEKLKTKIEAVHPYDVPCIIKIEVEANTAYETWVREQCC